MQGEQQRSAPPRRASRRAFFVGPLGRVDVAQQDGQPSGLVELPDGADRGSLVAWWSPSAAWCADGTPTDVDTSAPHMSEAADPGGIGVQVDDLCAGEDHTAGWRWRAPGRLDDARPVMRRRSGRWRHVRRFLVCSLLHASE